jgi:hypothetical protein
MQSHTEATAVVGTGDYDSLELLLTCGGDERIACNSPDARNKYGTPRGMALDEVWFSSSTASAISARGYKAAVDAGGRWLDGRSGVPEWFDGIRGRVATIFGASPGQVILSASGTELELINVALASHILRRPLLNLLTGPSETGSGVPLAAAGRYFLGSTPFRDGVECGSFIPGFPADCRVESVALRDSMGAPLPADAVDDAVAAKVETELLNGRDAQIHLLDCSKTGRSGVRASQALALLEQYHGRLLVTVDACQLRCSTAQIRAYVESGFSVMITGSKFAGGPPFSGALLLPQWIVEQLKNVVLPCGLLDYSASEDWPIELRRKMSGRLKASYNLGIGLRWEAALAELEGLNRMRSDVRKNVTRGFRDTVRRLVSNSPYLETADEDCWDDDERTIFAVFTTNKQKQPIPADEVRRHLTARIGEGSACMDRVFHVGQPVLVGNRAALRICLSAPHIIDVGDRMKEGNSFEVAFSPLARDLESLIEKWSELASRPALAGHDAKR